MRTPFSLKVDDAAWPLLQGLISYWGPATANGAAAGNTIVDAGLANEPLYVGHSVKVLDGNAAGQIRQITAHVGNTITVVAPFTDNAGAAVQILASTQFVILSGGGGGGGGGGWLPPAEGIYSHPSGVAEQIAFTITITRPIKLKSILLDFVNLTQNATIRIKCQIDGANYRTIETFNWTVGMDDGVYFREITVNHNVQVTIQSAVAEGAARNIPYEYFQET